MRRLIPILAASLLAACASEEALERGARYVDDSAFREDVLAATLVDPDNGYSALRLDRYGTDWAALDDWDPPVRPVTERDIGAFADDPTRPSTPEEGELAPVLGGSVEWTEEALLALGRRAFEELPVQIADTIGATTESREALERYGLWIDDRGRVGGLVRVRVADGTERFAVTCATCHARTDERGRLVHGATNAAFDWGAIAYDDALARGADPEDVHHLAQWGPGQVDVTPDGVTNAAAITDLRAVAHHDYLHWAGTIDNDLIALAIRLETLLVTSSQQVLRPPREVVFALALYVWRMGDDGLPGDRAAHPEGAELFSTHCATCHAADGSTPRPRVRIGDIGTDRAVGESSMRGTGFYRTPSLWRVGGRRQLLHDGSVSSLEELLDPARLEEVGGHDFGMALTPAERAALIDFLRSIGQPG